MADTSREFLKNLGLSTFDATGYAAHYILIYDNINKHQRAWHQKLSLQDCVQSGTSATIIMLLNAPNEAFDLTILAANCTKNECSELTTEVLLDDIDFPKLSQAGVGQILGVMIKHIPPLSQHAEVLKDAYTSRWAIHQIQPT